MDSRVVFFARDESEQQVLIAMELAQKERQVVLSTIPHQMVNESMLKQLNEQWKSGGEFEFPAECKTETRSFSEEHLLPASIKPDNPESLRRLRHEWTLRLLSDRLFESLKEDIGKLSHSLEESKTYTKEQWDAAIAEWGKITEHAKERNLLRPQVDQLRAQLNLHFEQLKKLREADQGEYVEQSAKIKEDFDLRLQAFQNELDPQKDNINHRFDQLKGLQNEVKSAKLTHKDRRKVWKKVDKLFGILKVARAEHFQSHLVNRSNGLERAIGKMEQSIGKDKRDLKYQSDKMARSSQLEYQLREAKIKVIEDRVRSKEEKLADMHRTLQLLKKKLKTVKVPPIVPDEPVVVPVVEKAAVAAKPTTEKKEGASDEAQTDASEEPQNDVSVEAQTDASVEPPTDVSVEAQTDASEEPQKEAKEEPPPTNQIKTPQNPGKSSLPESENIKQ